MRRAGLWLSVFVLSIGLAAAGSPNRPPDRAPQGARVDRQLADRLGRAGDNELQRVIVTMKPGTKGGLVNALRAQGIRVKHDFSLIEGFAGEVPAGLLRALQKHQDVVTLSSDAEVRADGATVSGTAQGTPYTLRSTLGLDTTFLGADSIATGATTSAKGTSVSSLSWSHTVTDGTNRILIVTTAHKDATKAVSSITYGGVPLSLRGGASGGTGSTSASTGLYYLLNPPVGTANVVVTMSAAVNVAASARVFTGVDQVTPFTPGAAGGMTSATASVFLLSQVGEVVISTMAATGDAKTLTLSGTGTSLWNDGTGTASANVRAAAATRPGGGTVTVGWTLGSSKPWGLVATTLRPGQVPVSVANTTRTGAGVTVAVIDSGLLQDGGGTSRIKTTRDFTTGNPNPAHIAALDGYGHGTHVAGLIAGDMAELKGIAPAAQYVSLRVLDNYGAGYTSNVIAAVEWAIANKATYGIDILNLSLGHPIYEPAASDPLVQAVEAAVRAHLVVVVSSGNYGTNPLTGEVGYAGISSPGNAPSAITVGALRTLDTASRGDDVIADYSSRGPTWYDGFAKPDLVAPGSRLLSAAATNQTLYTNYPALRRAISTRPYLTLSGTSMAAAVVSGTVALMIEDAKATYGAAPPVNAIKAMLQVSASPMTDAASQPYHVLAQGAGALNSAGALTLAHAINPTLPVDSYWLVTSVTKSTAVDGQALIWGDSFVWGNSLIWGDAIYTHSRIWGDAVIWGDSFVWGGSLVWGDNVVWGATGYNNNRFWGQSVIWGGSVIWGDALVWGDSVIWGNSLVSGASVVWGDVLAAP